MVCFVRKKVKSFSGPWHPHWLRLEVPMLFLSQKLYFYIFTQYTVSTTTSVRRVAFGTVDFFNSNGSSIKMDFIHAIYD